MLADTEIATTTLRPDLVLCSNYSGILHTVYFVKLTIPWEDAVDEASQRKRLRYAELAADAEQQGQRAMVCPLEVGCRGFVATSTTRLLKDLGIRGQALCQTIKETSGTADCCSQ